MSYCDSLILGDILTPCSETHEIGFENEGVLINREDIDFSLSEVNGNVISSIELAGSAKGYKITQPSINPYTGTQTAIATSTYYNSFTNQVQFVVMDNSPEVCEKIIDGLANGTFVIILENRTKTNGQAFQVYGWLQGLSAAELTCEKYNDDTEGGWLVTLEEKASPKSAMYFYLGNYDDTKEAFDNLTNGESVGVMYGYIPSYISGFSSTEEAKVASITEEMVTSARSAGYIKSARNLPIEESNAKTITTAGDYGYFVALIPNTMSYAVQQYDGLTGYTSFDADAGYYANGDITITIGDITYNVYAQFALASGTEFTIIIQ